MNILNNKIRHDLWAQKGRTLQVALIIGIGAFAVGLIIATRNLVAERLTTTWQASLPATIVLESSPPVDDEMIAALQRIEGVDAVEGYSIVVIEWRLREGDAWQPATLIVRADYEVQTYNQLYLTSGEWPQGKTFATWQGSDEMFDISGVGQVQIRVADREHNVPVSGVIADAANQPSGIGNTAQFYATRDRFADLLGTGNFNRIMAGTAVYDQTAAILIADQMQEKLEKAGIDSSGAVPSEGPAAGERITNPARHYAQEQADGVFLVLGIIATLALLLGLFLVYNTINAIISQQIDQIGVMKAIGASTGQIAQHYLTTILVYGGLAFLIAIPLGIVGSWGLAALILADFNIATGPFRISLPAIGAQGVVALLTPLLVSLVPIIRGAHITVREAISTYGLRIGNGRLEQWLARNNQLPRLFLLTISNTFRHKQRLILTQVTLVLSGLIFMMVMSVWDAARYTFDDMIFSILRFDVTLQLTQPERIQQVEQLTLSHPAVTAVELWAIQNGTLRPAGTIESNDDPESILIGISLPTKLYGPQIRAGRWLEPGDSQAMVLNEITAAKIGVEVGDWIVVDHGVSGETMWQVVGLLFDPVLPGSALVSRDKLLRELGPVGKVGTIVIQTTPGDADTETAVATDLRHLYEQNQFHLSPQSLFGADTASQATAEILAQFGILISVLAAMAVIIGLVGSIALSGVLSLNVMERRREIGVMRAIGAESSNIAWLFSGEGLLLSWLSWLIALPLSIPAGWLMIQALSQTIGISLIFHYTPVGALYWLGIITLLAIVASLLPIRTAMRISVRESLAYQ